MNSRQATKSCFNKDPFCAFRRLGCLGALLMGLCAVPAQAADVWLDFISGTGSDWVEQLNAATDSAGVADFSETERSTIESNILTMLESAYTDFLVDFSLTDPGGTRERINMGATTSGSSYGSAPLDFLNEKTGTQKVYTANFDKNLESIDSRSSQITEISTALAGTAAHELGHSVGLRHHAAYGTPGITTANYSNTGGLQNVHIMATGNTGLNETERETPRSFSPWSRLSMGAASDIPLVASPLPATSEDPGDAGEDPATAQLLTLTSRPLSGFNAALIVGGKIEEIAAHNLYDVDVYSFTGSVGDLLSAELWSDDQYSDDFDGQLTLIGPDGLTMLSTSDDTLYSGDKFGTGNKREDDSFLLNVPLVESGLHYLKVETVGADPEHSSGDAFGSYDLLIGVWPVPEPDTAVLVLGGLVSLFGLGRFQLEGRFSSQAC